MRMEHLYDLLEIEKHHSISAAAQAHYLSQTTLSSIVKSMEEELGFLIFKRTHCGVQTTAEGEEALAIIREILSRYEQIQQLGGPDTSRSPVPLILSPTISESLCLPLSRLFLEREPDGNLEFRTGVGDEIGSRDYYSLQFQRGHFSPIQVFLSSLGPSRSGDGPSRQ